jgi:hypothetical protein
MSAPASGSSGVMDGVSPHELFNRKLADFLEDLHCVVGHLPEYTLLSSSVKWLTQYDVTRNQKLFDMYVSAKYEDYILQHDEQFFLSTDYSDVGDMNLVHMLKRVWSTLTDKDKEAIWVHLHVLAILNRRCKNLAGAENSGA